MAWKRIVRHGDYLTIVRIVDDSIYFDEPLITSSTWLLDPRQQLVEPARVHVVEEVPGQLRAFVPHFLPGQNDQLRDFAVRVGLPFEATRGGRETQYPEYQHTLKAMLAETKAKTR